MIESIVATQTITEALPTDQVRPGEGTGITTSTGSFSDLITQGIGAVEDKVEVANATVQAFAIDDSVPIHQVTIALEEARLAVELAVQVRSRLVEGYREIMNMQL